VTRPGRVLLGFSLCFALTGVLWLLLGFETEPASSATAETPGLKGQVGASVSAPGDSVGVDRLQVTPRLRARLRCVDRRGEPWTFGAVRITTLAHQAVAPSTCDADGVLEFELPESAPALWVRGDRLFSEIARLKSTQPPLDYGEVRLRARGQLALEILGWDSGAGRSARISVVYPGDEFDAQLGFESAVEHQVVSGTARVVLEVEALRPLHVSLEGIGLRRSFTKQRVVVEPGERAELTLNLAELCRLDAELTGLPAAAFRGRGVEFLSVRPAERVSEQPPRIPISNRSRSVVDNAGRFTFLALDSDSSHLALDLGAYRVPLRPLDSTSVTVRPCDVRSAVFVPSEPLIAVGVFKRGAADPSAIEAAYCVGESRLGLLHRPINGWILLRRSEVERERQLTVFVKGRGWAHIDDALARVDKHGVLRIEPGDFVTPQGSLHVTLDSSPEPGVELVCDALDGSAGAFAEREAFESAVGARRGEREIVFRSLPSGRYSLIWKRNGQRRVAVEALQHDGASHVQRKLTPPRLAKLPGRVEFEEGAELVAPPTSFVVEGLRVYTQAGQFLYDGFESPPTDVLLRLATGAVVASTCEYERDSGELRLNVESLSTLLVSLDVAPQFRGRLNAEPWPYIEQPAQRPAAADYIACSPEGRLSVPSTGPAARGRVWELSEGVKILRGWYGESTGARDSFEGRVVTVQLLSSDGIVSLRALSDCDPFGAPLATAASDSEVAIWVPRSSNTLLVEYPTGAVRTVEISGEFAVVPQ
jgi:hypothetical protein